MRPRVFIGSSVEGLNIAYAIQENLEYDATVTIWTQGIFELSSTALDDLIKATNNFDFGIFVFNPDDLTMMRNQPTSTVRDNIIFELGLFIGKLGKEKVYFVLPNGIENFHIPTDLLGITAGTFDPKREDGNLKAALGPFCNKVRDKLKTFLYENIHDLVNESKEVKRLVIEKPRFWEYFLSAELLKTRLTDINRKYDELTKGLVFKKTQMFDVEQFKNWLLASLKDFTNAVEILKKSLEVELPKSFGEPGVAGNVLEIKSVIDRVTGVLNELLAWEYTLLSIEPPESLEEAKNLMRGWTKKIFDQFNKYPQIIEKAFSPENVEKEGPIIVNIQLQIDGPENLDKVVEIIKHEVLNS